MLSLLMVVLMVLAGPSRAQDAASAAQAQQRASAVTQVVLGIFSYARWPAEPVPLRLCLVGPTEYADDLLTAKALNSGQPLHVSRLLVGDPGLVAACDALYIGKLEPDERKHLFQTLLGHPVLSISESDDPCVVGSVFCLRISDQQVAFEVNLDAVARSGVRIHPSVLQLSRRRAVAP